MRTAVVFALIAQPTVQLIRFLSKAVLVWFLVAEELGEATFAGLLINVALIAAVFGLDDAVIYSERLGAGLWRRLRRLHHLTGLVMAVVVALAGSLIGMFQDYPMLGTLTAALAPSVWLANMSVLPLALLVRRREYQRVFFVDLFSVLALATATVGLAAAGAGPWSLVGGWYANALVAAVTAHLFALPFRPSQADAEDSGEQLASTLRYGRHMTGAGLTGFGSERVDQLVVSGLGAAAYGLYDWALHMSLFVSNYATNLSERVLFPALSERAHRGELSSAAGETLRVALIILLPLHVLLAMAAGPLVEAWLPAEWQAAAAPLMLLALAAGARSLDVVGLTVLKAAGRSGMVLGLGLMRIGLVTAGALVMIHEGIVGVALGVLVARVIAALVVLGLAWRGLPRTDHTSPVVARAFLCVAAWAALFVPLVRWAAITDPLLALAFQVTSAGVLWMAVRLVLDGAGCRRDVSAFTGWLATRSDS